MHIDQANRYNLRKLWQKYGAQALNSRHEAKQSDESRVLVNLNWPHRCWFDSDTQPNDFSWLENMPKATIFPVWLIHGVEGGVAYELGELSAIEQQLKNNQWHCMLEQTAMYLTLANRTYDVTSVDVQSRAGFTIKRVKTAQDINDWIDIVALSFGYSIEQSVIEKLINDADMQILIGYYHEEAIASALLYKTEDVIGIHQVGIKSSFQGKGFARNLMQEIITKCQLWQGKQLVLQASQAGKPLYESLGFTTQFLIKSYQKS